jgi:hypothetical protein
MCRFSIVVKQVAHDSTKQITSQQTTEKRIVRRISDTSGQQEVVIVGKVDCPTSGFAIMGIVEFFITVFTGFHILI